MTTKLSSCCGDIELLAVSLRAYFLLREVCHCDDCPFVLLIKLMPYTFKFCLSLHPPSFRFGVPLGEGSSLPFGFSLACVVIELSSAHLCREAVLFIL